MQIQFPVEVELEVLQYLEPSFSHGKLEWRSVTSTLVSCCLVCKAWRPICQKYLMKIVHLRSRKQLEGIVPVLHSAIHLGTSTRKLDLLPVKGEQPFHHVVPFYLATKLPSLERLQINGKTEAGFFPVHASLPMQLNQFRLVTSLALYSCLFQSFWDFRRVIVAFPALASLNISYTTWPDPFQRIGRPPPLLFTAQKLVEVSWNGNIGWQVVFLWATTLKPQALKVDPVTYGQLCPVFTVDYARFIGEIIMSSKQAKSKLQNHLHWSFDSKGHQCEPLLCLFNLC